MPTCTTPMTSRETEDWRNARRLTAQSADDQAAHVSPGEPHTTSDHDVIDFWGSGDSLSCLASWG